MIGIPNNSDSSCPWKVDGVDKQWGSESRPFKNLLKTGKTRKPDILNVLILNGEKQDAQQYFQFLNGI